MNQLSRWSPFRQFGRYDPLAGLEEAIGAIFPADGRQLRRAMEMRLDVAEDDKGYSVSVDMPGVRKEDIDVAVEGSQVTIRAEVKRDKSAHRGKEIHTERYEGEAYRSFTLPQEVDAAAAKAQYDGGVLTLALPKKNGSAARHVSIA
jgi:HSP20 family protein